MPRTLRKLKIRTVDTVDKGAGDGCQIAIRKRADGDGHEFKLIVRKDAEGRGTLQMTDDFRAMASYLGVKPGKLLKALNAPTPKPAPKPAPAPAQSFNKVMGIAPMKPLPPPARESFYTTLCKYAATKARADETAEQTFARVATTDPVGIDLMVANKVADVTSNRANFWPPKLPKEPDKAVLEPASTTAYENLMVEARDYAAAHDISIAVAFERVSRLKPDLFAVAKATYGPVFIMDGEEDEEADPNEAEPDDDEDDPLVKLHAIRDGIVAKNPTMHPGVALEKAMDTPEGRQHYAKYRSGVLGRSNRNARQG